MIRVLSCISSYCSGLSFFSLPRRPAGSSPSSSIMSKGPGLYADIGKKARDLLYKDYQSDQKFTITTYSPTGVAITSTGTKKGQLFIADVNTQLKNTNITTELQSLYHN